MRKLPVLLLLLFSATPMFGSDFSIFGGWSDDGKLKLDPATLDLKDVGTFGIRYEKDFAEVLGFENSVAYTNNVLTAEGETGQSGFSYSGNFAFNIPGDHIVPNFTVGLGFVYRAGDSFPPVGTSSMTNIGGGLKLRELAGPVGFRMDFRRFRYWGVEETSVGANELTGGIMISF